MLTQTLALLVDAYRELNAKRLFWIVLVLSALIVLAMAGIGINEKGITILWWTLEIPMINTGMISKPTFYKSFLFIPLGFNIWLSWAATILALISTASIIPDFVSSGSIELALSRPIGRLRLFLTKFVTGLLFVALQVSVFSVGAFLVIGIRGESWEPKIFTAIPLALAFFSYLFSFCALVGLITRSTISSLLVTGLLWIVIFLVHVGETGIVLRLKEEQKYRIEIAENRVQVALPKQIAEQEEKAKEPPTPTITGDSPEAVRAKEEYDRAKRLASRAQERVDRLRENLTAADTRLKELRDGLPKFERIHTWFYAAKSILPKTSETLGLLERQIVSISDLDRIQDPNADLVVDEDDVGGRIDPRVLGKRMDVIIRSRSVGWVVGTSLAFEFCILGIAAWIFCGRDF
ncbi:MAG: ABC transporter permease [Phycisphaerales bacterium]|nr:ABC transporter permease [Phycisphaerales bacterium]